MNTDSKHEKESKLLIEKAKNDLGKKKGYPGYDLELQAIKDPKFKNKYFSNPKPYKLTSIEKDRLKDIHNIGYRPFYEDENLLSLEKSKLIGPFYMEDEFFSKNKKSLSDGIYLATLTKNKYKRIKCLPFAIYEEKTKTFYFLNRQSPFMEDICKTDYNKKFQFCNHYIIKNVDIKTAYSLALFFRISVYLEINYYKNKNYLKYLGLKTTNFIVTNIHDYPGNPYIFMIADYGIKDKSLNNKEIQEIISVTNEIKGKKENKLVY